MVRDLTTLQWATLQWCHDKQGITTYNKTQRVLRALEKRGLVMERDCSWGDYKQKQTIWNCTESGRKLILSTDKGLIAQAIKGWDKLCG